MIYRLKAAFSAFCDPALVGEALGMRQTLSELHPGSNEFALLYSEPAGPRIYPKVQMLSYRDRERIRDTLGRSCVR